VRLTGAEAPPTIHDFYGFPRELFAVRYPAPGQPALAIASRRCWRLRCGRRPLARARHGCWSVPRRDVPDADVPVVQLSLDSRQPGRSTTALAKELRPLRDDGVLILGSGNVVHNLRLADFGQDGGYDWADSASMRSCARGSSRRHAALATWEGLGPDAPVRSRRRSTTCRCSTFSAVQQPGDAVRLFNAATVLGSISMTSVSSTPSVRKPS
jgi:4,5-DOPA dioxygenase extradiol